MYMLLFESFNKIEAICQKYNIKNYTINSDGSVDVDGNVSFNSLSIVREVVGILPLVFRRVEGDFDCSQNLLSTLIGAPKSVGGMFLCIGNHLTTLEGGPESVVKGFNCSNNRLITLKSAPQSVGGHFDCSYNQLTTLEGAPKSVKGNFYCSSNQLTTLKGAPESLVVKIVAGNNPIATKSYFESYLDVLKKIRHGEKIPNTLITPSLLVFLKEKHTEVYQKVISSTDEESTKIKDILGDFGFD